MKISLTFGLNGLITSTPFAVLALLATRFAACTGGIRVTFMIYVRDRETFLKLILASLMKTCIMNIQKIPLVIRTQTIQRGISWEYRPTSERHALFSHIHSLNQLNVLLTHCGIVTPYAVNRLGSGSTMAQVMACRLTAPSHYLNQCWLLISKVQWHPSESNFTRDTTTISHWN